MTRTKFADRPLTISTGKSSDQITIVGEVLDLHSSEHPNKICVSWRTPEGELITDWVSAVRGLHVEIADLVLLQRPCNWPEFLLTHTIQGSAAVSPEAKVDGKRVEIEGHDEVVLRCGQASITLRKNGRVIIRGTYVESRSSGTNRIKGGAVLIN